MGMLGLYELTCDNKTSSSKLIQNIPHTHHDYTIISYGLQNEGVHDQDQNSSSAILEPRPI